MPAAKANNSTHPDGLPVQLRVALFLFRYLL